MNLKQLINKSVYGSIGYISSQDDIDLLEQYILYNLPVLKEFKHIVVATNYKEFDLQLINRNIDMWEKYFPNCYLIDSRINRGHNFGTADLDNLVFEWCKENNEEWLCKGANDIILQETILEKEIEEADFYYLNGISYETLYLNNFDYEQISKKHFIPQTNFYFINVSKCDYLNNKQYLDETYEYSKTIDNYNGKIWEYIKGWSCEDFLKNCVNRNNLKTYYLLDDNKHKKLCEVIKMYQIGDPSHKNIMIEGICHFQYPNQEIIEIY
jgi:hypothetical protein